MDEDILDELGITDRDFTDVRRLLAELDDELGEQRIMARSGGGNVAVTVDGRGRIVDIVTSDVALRSAHPQRLGGEILEAVGAARAEVGTAARARIVAFLAPDQPAGGRVDR